MTVGEFLSRASSREITDWRVFFRMEAEQLEAERKRAQAGQGGEEKHQRLGGGQVTVQDAITAERKRQGLDP